MNDKFGRELSWHNLVASQNLPGETEEIHKKHLNQDNQCPSRDLNQVPPKYKSIALLQCQPVCSM
jgi:hypothetical protein